MGASVVGASVVGASVVMAAASIVVMGSTVVVLEGADGLSFFLEQPEIAKAMVTAVNLIIIIY